MKWLSTLVITAICHTAWAWDAELQWRLCGQNLQAIVNKFQDASDSKKRLIYYFETENFDLFMNNIVIRDRVTPKKNKLQRTLKITISNKQYIPQRFRDLENFKCEYDIHDDFSKFTCSIDEIDEDPDHSHSKLRLSSEQIDLIRHFKPQAYPFLAHVRRLGTLNAIKIRLKEDGYKFDIEESKYKNTRFIEISMKTESRNRSQMQKYFLELLINKKIQRCEDQSTITKEKLRLLDPQ